MQYGCDMRHIGKSPQYKASTIVSRNANKKTDCAKSRALVSLSGLRMLAYTRARTRLLPSTWACLSVTEVLSLINRCVFVLACSCQSVDDWNCPVLWRITVWALNVCVCVCICLCIYAGLHCTLLVHSIICGLLLDWSPGCTRISKALHCA